MIIDASDTCSYAPVFFVFYCLTPLPCPFLQLSCRNQRTVQSYVYITILVWGLYCLVFMMNFALIFDLYSLKRLNRLTYKLFRRKNSHWERGGRKGGGREREKVFREEARKGPFCFYILPPAAYFFEDARFQAGRRIS